jgi:hypothetical protein
MTRRSFFMIAVGSRASLKFCLPEAKERVCGMTVMGGICTASRGFRSFLHGSERAMMSS